jgi:hypothetical protein
MRGLKVWIAALFLLIGLTPCRAQKASADALRDRVLRATAMVLITNTEYQIQATVENITTGSAFCISDQGYYITNAHVVEGISDGFALQLLLCTGLHSTKNVTAYVLGRDKTLDLALLKVKNPSGMHPLSLGPDAAPERGASVMLSGYPGGLSKMPVADWERDVGTGMQKSDIPPAPPGPPQVAAMMGHVTNLYGEGRVLQAIEVDIKARHGCSGGPIVNRKGQVVGVIRAVNRANGRGIAIPLRDLKGFLARPTNAVWLASPEIRVEPASIPAERCAQEQPFVVHLRRANGTGFPSLAGITAYVFLTPRGIQPLRLEAKPSGNSTFSVPFVPVPSVGDTRFVTLIARRNGQTDFYYHVKDQMVSVGGTAVLLSQISRITNGDTPSVLPSVLLADGREQTGPVAGLDALELPLRDTPAVVSLNTAQSISVQPLSAIPQSVYYGIQVAVGKYVVAEKHGEIPIAGAPPSKPQAGMVVACADEWPTRTTGVGEHASELTPSTRQYIRNIANLFTEGAPGRFLICSEDEFGKLFQDTLREAGHSVSIARMPEAFTGFTGYDGVFVGQKQVLIPELIAYVKQGGRVYVAGGISSGSPAQWNPFLSAFGLVMSEDNRSDAWRVTPNTSLVLFAGVTDLKAQYVSKLDKLPGDWPNTFLTPQQFGDHLWGIYSSDKDVTAPLSNTP